MSTPRCGPIPTPSHGRASCSWEARSRRKAIATTSSARPMCCSVLRAHADTTMVGLDVTHRCLFGDADVAQWTAAATAGSRRIASLLVGIAGFSIRANRESDPIFAAGMPLHDPLAAAVAIDPGLVSTLDLPMIVETRTGDGSGVRGRTIGNPRGVVDNAPPVHVALGVDGDGFVRRFTDTIRGFLASIG